MKLNEQGDKEQVLSLGDGIPIKLKNQEGRNKKNVKKAGEERKNSQKGGKNSNLHFYNV